MNVNWSQSCANAGAHASTTDAINKTVTRISSSRATSPLAGAIVTETGKRAKGGCYNRDMRIASGKVVDGRVELDTDLPEGASVTVLALEGDETFEADEESEKMLLEAIAQCERGQITPFADLLSELRNRE